MNQSADTPGNDKSFVETIYNNTISALRSVFNNIRRNFILFILFLAVPCAFLVVRNISKPVAYSASFTVSYEELTRKIYGDRIEKINALANSDNDKMLAQILGVPQAAASTLLEIQGKNIIGQPLSEDMNIDKIPFVIVLIIKDTTYINTLQDGLVNFLGTGSPYLATKRALKATEIQQELIFIDRQLAYLDSMKKKINISSIVGKQVESNPDDNAISVNSMYEFSYDLYRKKQELERKKLMPDNLQVIDDIVVPSKVQHSNFKAIALGIAIGLFCYAMVMLFIIPVVRQRDAKNI